MKHLCRLEMMLSSWYIDESGFGGVVRTGQIQLDHALVTALVERWRTETHSFHLPIGEATVTLQDIGILWGLPIDGQPVIGVDTHQKSEDWLPICEDLLGFRPKTDDIKGGKLLLGCLDAPLAVRLPSDASDDDIRCHARMRILQLIGGHLFSDKSGNMVSLMYLSFLRDFTVTRTYSWGSAVLAFLYRGLCRATLCTSQEIAGPLVLLQLWTWERFPTLCPDRPVPKMELPAESPYGARWNVDFNLSRVAMHVLVVYRDQLDSLRDDHSNCTYLLGYSRATPTR
ncbi:serine/threonine-protein phosphatase 7 long form homolog [Coffea arabica]|uniref:Serine/threonine-protein phosphatase 7 long form homolog n=1 Tax=Coffea arabica TaxID=13443 RepID=A0ABM4VUL3_COFAR